MLLKAPVRSRISLGPPVRRGSENSRAATAWVAVRSWSRAGDAEDREGPEPQADEARRHQRRETEGPRLGGHRFERGLPPPELGRGGLVEAVEYVLELHRRMSVPGWQRARVEELPVLLEARAGLPQEVVLHGRRQEPLEAVDVTRGRAHPVPEDRQEGGILEDGVPPLHAPKRGDVLEQADLDADRRDPLIHQASVRFRQLSGDYDVPADEGPHDEEETAEREAQLMAEAKGRHTRTAHEAYKSGAKRVMVSRWR